MGYSRSRKVLFSIVVAVDHFCVSHENYTIVLLHSDFGPWLPCTTVRPMQPLLCTTLQAQSPLNKLKSGWMVREDISIHSIPFIYDSFFPCNFRATQKYWN